MRSRDALTRASARWLSTSVSPCPGKCSGGHRAPGSSDPNARPNIRGHIPSHVIRILAEAANINHRIRRIVVHIRHRREIHCTPNARASRAVSSPSYRASSTSPSRRSPCYTETSRHPSRASTLRAEIRAHQQRSLRHLLHLIQKQRERVRLRVARDAVLHVIVARSTRRSADPAPSAGIPFISGDFREGTSPYATPITSCATRSRRLIGRNNACAARCSGESTGRLILTEGFAAYIAPAHTSAAIAAAIRM